MLFGYNLCVPLAFLTYGFVNVVWTQLRYTLGECGIEPFCYSSELIDLDTMQNMPILSMARTCWRICNLKQVFECILAMNPSVINTPYIDVMNLLFLREDNCAA